MENFNKEDYKLKCIIITDDCPGNYWIGSDPREWTVIKETDTEIELFRNDESVFVVLNKHWVIKTIYVRKKQN